MVRFSALLALAAITSFQAVPCVACTQGFEYCQKGIEKYYPGKFTRGALP